MSTKTTVLTAAISDGEFSLAMEVEQVLRTELVSSDYGQPPIAWLKEIVFHVTGAPPLQLIGKTVRLETPTGELWWVVYDGTQFVTTQNPAAAA